jgi:hypothetical protein
MRELIIGQRSRGYVALYRYVPEIDAVLCLRCEVNMRRVTREAELATGRTGRENTRTLRRIN